MATDKRFAVLIDADNVSDKYVSNILDEVSADGVATYKRIYGDWTKPTLVSWKSVLLNNSIIPVQQYSYTTGKNATDSAMIIDAMDILYSGNVDGFCIVSSDSDFTRLAARLRESGMYVIGMGEKKTPTPFISACNKFKFLEVLAVPQNTESTPVKDVPIQNNLETLKRSILTLTEEFSDEDGWAFLGDIGNQLQRRNPDFDVRNYGFTKFKPLIEHLNVVEVRTEQLPGQKSKLVYIRKKTTAPKILDVPRPKR
ncbi:MAG: NYN domain-containing protein [Acutalibacteraceae bacterium]|jgi:uncharacterized LabA/DUF88 family protein